jgi:hypothetical protein
MQIELNATQNVVLVQYLYVLWQMLLVLQIVECSDVLVFL